MAIDTVAKRMSMLTFASPLAWQHHFEVDGAVDADDRAHLLHLYGGNALAVPVPVIGIGVAIRLQPMHKTLGRMMR
jgi:hypothetical protein